MSINDVEDIAVQINYTVALLKCLSSRINSICDDAQAVKDSSKENTKLTLQQLFFNVDEHANQLDALTITSIQQLSEQVKALNKYVNDVYNRRDDHDRRKTSKNN